MLSQGMASAETEHNKIILDKRLSAVLLFYSDPSGLLNGVWLLHHNTVEFSDLIDQKVLIDITEALIIVQSTSQVNINMMVTLSYFVFFSIQKMPSCALSHQLYICNGWFV